MAWLRVQQRQRTVLLALLWPHRPCPWDATLSGMKIWTFVEPTWFELPSQWSNVKHCAKQPEPLFADLSHTQRRRLNVGWARTIFWQFPLDLMAWKGTVALLISKGHTVWTVSKQNHQFYKQFFSTFFRTFFSFSLNKNFFPLFFQKPSFPVHECLLCSATFLQPRLDDCHTEHHRSIQWASVRQRRSG